MIYRFGDCELDTRVYSLRRNGEKTRLQPRVYRLLKYFLDHRDRVISKDELSEHIWPKQFISNTTLLVSRKFSRAQNLVGGGLA